MQECRVVAMSVQLLCFLASRVRHTDAHASLQLCLMLIKHVFNPLLSGARPASADAAATAITERAYEQGGLLVTAPPGVRPWHQV